MFRLTRMLVVGLFVAGFASGCGSKKETSTPPQEEIPIVDPPTADGGGQKKAPPSKAEF